MAEISKDEFEAEESKERRVLRVKTADIKTARSPWILETLAVGSCVAISLYDPVEKMGGLCHSLLPEPNADDEPPSPKFTTEAVDIMMEDLKRDGASSKRLEAKIIGGANLFEALGEGTEMSMGRRNVEAARTALEKLGVRVVGEDVGGALGRSMALYTDTGKVRIRSADGTEKVL